LVEVGRLFWFVEDVRSSLIQKVIHLELTRTKGASELLNHEKRGVALQICEGKQQLLEYAHVLAEDQGNCVEFKGCIAHQKKHHIDIS